MGREARAKLKARVFKYWKYRDTLSYKNAKTVMGDYENERGWALLEHLTTPQGLHQAIKNFYNKQKRSKK